MVRETCIQQAKEEGRQTGLKGCEEATLFRCSRSRGSVTFYSTPAAETAAARCWRPQPHTHTHTHTLDAHDASGGSRFAQGTSRPKKAAPWQMQVGLRCWPFFPGDAAPGEARLLEGINWGRLLPSLPPLNRLKCQGPKYSAVPVWGAPRRFRWTSVESERVRESGPRSGQVSSRRALYGVFSARQADGH